MRIPTFVAVANLAFSGCAPRPLTTATFEMLDTSIPTKVLACDGVRTTVITPEDFSIVRKNKNSLAIEATLTGPPLLHVGDWNGAQVVVVSRR